MSIKNNTDKLINYYNNKNILVEIDAEKDIDKVSNDIIDVIEEKIR